VQSTTENENSCQFLKLALPEFRHSKMTSIQIKSDDLRCATF